MADARRRSNDHAWDRVYRCSEGEENRTGTVYGSLVFWVRSLGVAQRDTLRLQCERVELPHLGNTTEVFGAARFDLQATRTLRLQCQIDFGRRALTPCDVRLVDIWQLHY